MKKILISLSFIFIVTIASNANVRLWQILYSNANTLKEKRNILMKIQNTATEDYKDFILKIMEEQVFHPTGNNVMEKRYFDEWVYYTNKIYQKLKIKEGGEHLQKLYKDVENPVYKGELLFSFGQLEDKTFVPWLNAELNNFNELHRMGKTSGYKESLYGVIKALHALKDESSFYYLFYVAVPNYSDEIRAHAQAALKDLTNDPADLCNEVIIKEADPRIVLEALHYALDSESPDEKKINTCKVALKMSIYKLVKNEEMPIQRQIRNDATLAIGKLKPSTDTEVINLLKKRWDYKPDKDVKSRLAIIEALKNISSDDSVKLLSDFLTEFNELKDEETKTGFIQEEGGKIIIALIKALGETKNEIALEALYSIELNKTFGTTIRNFARESIEEIENSLQP